jgi:hypothetical protein
MTAAAVGLSRGWAGLGQLSPEEIREVMVKAARDEVAAPPCFWVYVLVIMGKTAKRAFKMSVPRCVVKEAIRRIVLGVIDGSKPNWMSFDNVRLIVTRYAEKHKCEYGADAEAAVAGHARIIAGYVREWVRLLADGGAAGSLEHMTLSQAVLHQYLSSQRYC